MRFKYKKMILSASCSIMLLGMMIFSTRNSLVARVVGNGKKTATDSAVTSGNSIDTKNSELAGNSTDTAIDGKTTEDTETGENAKGISLLMKNAYPEVNKLIANYFGARMSVDKDAIKDVVDDINYAGIDKLSELNKNIEHIKLVDCYTIDGPEKGAFMVYAKIKIKFRGIETAASGIDGFYVRPDSTGKPKIVLSPVSDEVQKIIDEDTERDDVVALLKAVNTELAHELQSDKKLSKFFGKLQKKTNDKNNTEEKSKSRKSKKTKKTEKGNKAEKHNKKSHKSKKHNKNGKNK